MKIEGVLRFIEASFHPGKFVVASIIRAIRFFFQKFRWSQTVDWCVDAKFSQQLTALNVAI